MRVNGLDKIHKLKPEQKKIIMPLGETKSLEFQASKQDERKSGEQTTFMAMAMTMTMAMTTFIALEMRCALRFNWVKAQKGKRKKKGGETESYCLLDRHML